MKNISSITYDANGNILSSQECTQGHPSKGPAVEADEASADAKLPARSGDQTGGVANEETRLSMIRAAIDGMDRSNPDLWTKSGKPRIEAIEALLDGPISLSERDAAWASSTTE